MHFDPPHSSYQDVPYPNDPYRSSHPDHLATVAILSGMTPPAVARSRVLELGCARGGNLIPMAAALPAATFLGVDASSRQVDEARALIDSLGLSNIRIEPHDILTLDHQSGIFDYIICHGTFSWVEPGVQDKILEICSTNLAPDGLAYLSYNTYPGWHFRGVVRDMMCFHTRRFDRPDDRAREARKLLHFMTSSTQGIEPVYSDILKQELEYVTERSDSYLLHDHLEMVNDPVYFHDFVSRASSHGLQFVSEVQGTLIPEESLPPGIADGLREFAANQLEFEQFLDFVLNRRFRQSVLCHAEMELRGGVRPIDLSNLHVAAKNIGDQVTAASRDVPILKTALNHLHQIWPLSLRFDSLFEAACLAMAGSTGQPNARLADARAEFTAGLVRCYSQKRVELGTLPPSFVLSPGPKPVASPVARAQAQTGDTVTNLRHEAGQLNDFGREVLCALDGTNNREAIVARLVEAVENGRITLPRKGQSVAEPGAPQKTLEESAQDSLDDCLLKLARFALLIS